ncbi:MAG: HAMP domain-containing protein [Holophaga sp.]|nr:HAMP domain-containing protein [Holophaga sp.]
MKFRFRKIIPWAWFKSLHAKLFILTALVTSGITVAVAFQINRNSRRELLAYSKKLAIETSQAVEADITTRDPTFSDPRKIEEVLEGLAGEGRAIFQIDVFKAEGKDQINFVTSSNDDSGVDWKPGMVTYMTVGTPTTDMVDLIDQRTEKTNRGWRVYYPIHNPKEGRPPIGLIRTYCDLERWEDVWQANLENTLKLLPPVLLGEFILLWVILGAVLSDPLKSIMEAMRKLERGDASARANVAHKDELGQIALRFNQMASQLERASAEREALVEEIRGLNSNLQDRIDLALAELQAKNQELEQLMERNGLLREELGQQERLAVAGQLTAAFAHEVGTPLNLVHSHLQLLNGQTDLGDRTRERLGVIQAQIERVGEIVRKLLGHTRRPRLHQEVLSLAALVADLQRLWTPTLALHHIHFHMEAPDPCILFVDRKQMEQIFINLVNNAVDAMPEGGEIHLQVAADSTSRPASPRWSFRLTDTGSGIPSELLAKVFKPMFTTKPEGKGTGLGLAIVREIIRAHGGEVHIESQEGQGTSVLFTLPGVTTLEA